VFVREPTARSAADLHCLCHDCAGEQRTRRFAHSAAPPSVALPLALAGVVLGTLGVGADWIAPGLSAGFGWQQRLGLVLGGLAVVIGAILRFDLMVVGGCLLFSAAVSADFFGTHASPGVGWKQQLVLLVAAAFLFGAFLLRQWQRRQAARGAGQD
jgi:hypothetical protein